MINSHPSEIMLVKEEKLIGETAYDSSAKLIEYLSENISRKFVSRGSKAKWQLHFIIKNRSKLKHWRKKDVDLAMIVLSSRTNKDNLFKVFDVEVPSNSFTDKYNSLRSLLRLIMLQLWIDKIILLPREFIMPLNHEHILDFVCPNSGIRTLTTIRALNDNSS